MVRRILLFTTLWLILFSVTALNAAELQVQLSHSQIVISESVTLNLSAIGSIDSEPDFSVLEADFDIIKKSHSSKIQYVSGNISKSKVWNLVLGPKRSGRLLVPPLCSGSDCSAPAILIVSKQNDSDTAPIIIEAEVSSNKIVAQQQLIYTIRLWIRQSLLKAGLGELKPEGVETTVYSLGDDIRYEADRGNWRYKVLERKFVLFPQHAGQLYLPPIRFDGQLEDNNRSRVNSPFGGFRQAGQVVRLRSEAINITVTEQSVTSSQQPWLPAQKVMVADDWQQTAPTLTVGEPATRTIITTAAALTAAHLPELTIAAPDSFKIYPDKAKREDKISATGIIGTLAQKVAFVPTQAGTFTFPPLQLKWWDTGNNKWQIETTMAVTIQVLPAQRVVSAPGNSAVSTPQPAPLIQPPAAAPVSNLGGDSPNASQKLTIWIWISAICAVGWIITLVLLLQSRKQRQQKPSVQTPIIVNDTIPKSKARAKLIRCAQSNDPVQTRTALLVWITSVAPEIEPEIFIRQLDSPLQQQLSKLNSALYSADSSATWSGEELANALKSWTDTRDKKNPYSLPDFYPQG